MLPHTADLFAFVPANALIPRLVYELLLELHHHEMDFNGGGEGGHVLKVDNAKCHNSHFSIAALTLLRVPSNGRTEARCGCTMHERHERGIDDSVDGKEHCVFAARWS